MMTRGMITAVVAAGVASVSMAQTPAAPPPPKTWADNVAVKGDIRYRYESIGDDSKKDSSGETYTRQRNRIRARVNVEAKCNSNIKAGIGLSTGQSDPISGNQTLSDGLGKKDMKLDLAYLDYNFMLDDPSEIHLVAGKMKNPFITLPEDLVWDGDATPEGVALKSELGGDSATFLGNAGYLWLQERSDTEDAMLYAAQAALKLRFAPEVALTVGGTYYAFQNLKGYNVIDWEGKNNSYGNSTVDGTVSSSGSTNKAWKCDFTPAVFFAKLNLWAGGLPISLFGQKLSNGDATDHDSGHMYGVSLGRSKNVGTAEIGFSYAELEKNATLGMLTDSDRWGGGTDGKGSRVYGKYQLMKNLQAAVTYLMDDKKISDPSKTTGYDRLQVDIAAKF